VIDLTIPPGFVIRRGGGDPTRLGLEEQEGT
jgi:hypothetical protein